jgi:hypothetical protein
MNNINRKNLKQLADHLWSLPADYNHFDMSFYFGKFGDEFLDLEPPEAVNMNVIECNTAACALGHSFAAGLPYNNESFWEDYCQDVFGISVNSRIYDWCFSSDWTETDNTPKGAAKRIYYLLENETIPVNFGYANLAFVETYQNQKTPKL